MADWNLPTVGSLFTDVIAELAGKDSDSATLFLNAPSNQPTGSIRWNRITFILEEWDGLAWQPLIIAIEGGGTGTGTGAPLGTMASQDSDAVSITGGTITGLASLGVSGTVTAGAFVGDGSGITGLQADQVSGVLAKANLPASVAYENEPNLFTENQQIVKTNPRLELFGAGQLLNERFWTEEINSSSLKFIARDDVGTLQLEALEILRDGSLSWGGGSPISSSDNVGGGLLQVLNNQTTTQVSKTTASFASVGMPITVTPQSSLSTIFISGSVNITSSSAGNLAGLRITRDGSTIVQDMSGSTGLFIFAAEDRRTIPISFNEPSPGAGTPVTYSVEFARLGGAGNITVQVNSNPSTVELREELVGTAALPPPPDTGLIQARYQDTVADLTTTSATFLATGLSMSFTPVHPNTIIVITGQFIVTTDNGTDTKIGVRITRNGTEIWNPGQKRAITAFEVLSIPVRFVETSPGAGTPVTYQIEFSSIDGAIIRFNSQTRSGLANWDIREESAGAFSVIP